MEQKLAAALEELKKLGLEENYESSHGTADQILVDLLRAYGCPEEILEAYDNVGKWYS